MKKMRKAVVGQILVLVFMISGGTLLGGLALGDAQWQYYTNHGICDSKHYIKSVVPISDKENGGFIPYKFVVSCNKWFKQN